MSELTYPKDISLDGDQVQIRRLSAGDGPALHAFAEGLPTHDLLYTRRDLTKRPVIDAWIDSVVDGDNETLIAEQSGEIIAATGLFVDPKAWSPHVGEIRVLVGERWRSRGLGRALIQECFLCAIERGLRKIVAQMTVDQKGAQAVFEEMGFSGEALLKDHVQDRVGGYHDILILSCNVATAETLLSSYR